MSRPQNAVARHFGLRLVLGLSCLIAAGDVRGQVDEGPGLDFTGRQIRLAVGDVGQETPEETAATSHTPRLFRDERGGFREVNRFFYVREANPDVHQNEWLAEIRSFYATRSDSTDDDFALLASIAYGLTDDLMIELDLMPMNMGDGGGQGNGDLSLELLYRFVEETESFPAVAGWTEMRIPTGDGSSKVDASFNLGMTRTLTQKLRLNVAGGIETLNGARGDESGFGRVREFGRDRLRARARERFIALPKPLAAAEFARSFYEAFGVSEPGRRSFRWNVGVGLDYVLSTSTIGVVNYLHRSNEDEGLRNQHLLEVGVVQALTEHQVIKAAVDVGLTGAEDTPNFGVKLQYGISF